jgi:diguanylate cyclase (GGDEF)-like protein
MKVAFKHSDLFARLGGDEFVVLFDGLQQQQSEALLMQFDRYLHQQSVSLNRRYRLQFSSGVVEFDPANPQSLEQLLHDSDKQMYLTKNQKRIAV